MSLFELSVDGWLGENRQCSHHASPNHNMRPADCDINLLVLHNISLPAGEFGSGYIEKLFTNCLDCSAHSSFSDLEGLQVSSHLLIDRQGTVCQFVPFNLRAWHAGLSIYNGIENCNDYSIGIELEGCDEIDYTSLNTKAL